MVFLVRQFILIFAPFVRDVAGLDVDAEKEIPSCELIATKCIGSGVTSEVYQGHWNRIGRVAWCRVGKCWEDGEPEELVGEGSLKKREGHCATGDSDDQRLTYHLNVSIRVDVQSPKNLPVNVEIPRV